tara:strand:- start:4340 stop:5173 length:834 start_codon:yes stop_codon:yes gene_type:complete
MKDSTLLKLDYLSILEINGKGSFDLLQGQITADVNKVSDNNCVVGAMCDIKGRVISSFVVIKNFTKDDGFMLIGNKDSLKILNEALIKFVPFYKTQLRLNDQIEISAIKEATLLRDFPEADLSKTSQTLDNFQRVHYLNKDFHLLIAEEISAFGAYEIVEKPNLWKLDEIKQHNFEISSSTTGIFTAHELGYDKSKRIDFEKGCYTGQEVVARMQYRAKKLPKLLCRESKNTYEVMSKIYNDLEKQIGTVLSSAKSENTNHYLLSMNKNYQNEDFEF